MAMEEKELFESVAPRYDEEFTFTEIGRRQREMVHRYLRRVTREDMDILEINCGTGEDAMFLASCGCRVTATDLSPGMIRAALRKSRHHPAGQRVTFKVMAFADLGQLEGSGPYDLVFSDFSGLNCLPPEAFPDLSENLSKLLKPGGRMILMLFGKKCLWERIYMTLKGRFRAAGRRNTDSPVLTGEPGTGIRIWYYSPKQLRTMFGTAFKRITARPVGLFIPPSYLNGFFTRRFRMLSILGFLERHIGGAAFFANYGDHYLIHFRKS